MTMQGRAPVVSGASAAHFWDACREHRYELQKCDSCGRVRYPAIPLCPHCLSRSFTWIESPGQGKVYTFTVVGRAPAPAFEAFTPYVVALVDLDEGVRVMGNIIDCAVGDVEIGLPVQVTFQEVEDGVVLPQFTPTGYGG
jgi:uncharacterized OB-fold protein